MHTTQPPPGPMEATEPGNIRLTLREATAARHRHLEELVGLPDSMLSLSRYARVLQAFHGIYAALEPPLASVVSRLEIAFPVRRRAPLLAEDLAALRCGTGPGDRIGLSPCSEVPVMTTAAHAAGCLYVLEGACLGGQVIARSLEPLGLTSGHGASFFVGDGPDTGSRWRSFLQWLRLVASEGRQEDIVWAACATFDSFHREVVARGAARAH